MNHLFSWTKEAHYLYYYSAVMKLILTGGFLGSGKTTAINNACAQLIKENRKVAVITNDQGEQQVDSAYINSCGIPLREVANSCFCCNYTLLDNHIQTLFEEEQPELIFAESVGSCTDLVSTVAKPFAQYRPNYDVVISVFADASLLLRLLEGKLSFIKESIRYIFKKQLEEADVLVLNKVDLITQEEQAFIDSIIYNEYPGKIILHQNSLREADIKKWLHTMMQFKTTGSRKSLDIDYDLYGEGEAHLAWLDKKISIHSYHHNAIQIAERIARDIHAAILQHQLTIGHLKYFMESRKWQKKLSATMTNNDFNSLTTEEPSDYCNMLINARVQTEPSLLRELVYGVIQKIMNEFSCKIIIENSSSFIPGYPRPTHRFVE